MAKSDYDDLRALIKYCCEKAATADDGALAALRRVAEVSDKLTAYIRQTNSRLRTLELHVRDLLRRVDPDNNENPKG